MQNFAERRGIFRAVLSKGLRLPVVCKWRFPLFWPCGCAAYFATALRALASFRSKVSMLVSFSSIAATRDEEQAGNDACYGQRPGGGRSTRRCNHSGVARVQG